MVLDADSEFMSWVVELGNGRFGGMVEAIRSLAERQAGTGRLEDYYRPAGMEVESLTLPPADADARPPVEVMNGDTIDALSGTMLSASVVTSDGGVGMWTTWQGTIDEHRTLVKEFLLDVVRAYDDGDDQARARLERRFALDRRHPASVVFVRPMVWFGGASCAEAGVAHLAVKRPDLARRLHQCGCGTFHFTPPGSTGQPRRYCDGHRPSPPSADARRRIRRFLRTYDVEVRPQDVSELERKYHTVEGLKRALRRELPEITKLLGPEKVRRLAPRV